VLETSFKYHASCRHTHPAADTLLKGMEERGLTADDIARVRARVHAAAMAVLGPVSDPRTIHQSKFSMGFVLALIAKKGSAGIDDFTEEALEDAGLRAFSEKVEMVLDEEVDAAYPHRWIRVVEIETSGGERFTSRVEVPKGDPGNTLSREELEEKARNLAAYGGGASAEEMDRIVARIWSLDEETDVRDLLPDGSA
jgi:2-methylcitrate dehydratase PrpD